MIQTLTILGKSRYLLDAPRISTFKAKITLSVYLLNMGHLYA